ncbi:unnamed protein product [Calypogeia fissa]
MLRTRSQTTRRAQETVWVDVEVVEDLRDWSRVTLGDPQGEQIPEGSPGDSSSDTEAAEVEAPPDHQRAGEMGDKDE